MVAWPRPRWSVDAVLGPASDVTLAFLPGSLCDERLFSHQVEHLSRSYATSVADFTGMTTIEAMADGVLDSVAGPLIPIGLSLGGIVAAELLDRAADRIPAAVLLGTNLDVPRRAQLVARHRWASQARAGQFADVVQEMVPWLTADVAKHGAMAADMALDAGPLRFLDENEALINRRHDRRPNVGRFGRPVLVMVGDQDRVCPPSVHEDLVERAANASLEIVPGAGHLVTTDQPEQVTDTLVSWLARLEMNTYTG